MANEVWETAGRTERERWSIPLPALLRMFWAGSAVAFALMVLVALIERAMGFSHFHYNPLGGARYEDLMEFPPVYRLLHTAAFFEGVGESRVAYPPLGAVIYAPIYASGHAIGEYLTTAAVWRAAGGWGARPAPEAGGVKGGTERFSSTRDAV